MQFTPQQLAGGIKFSPVTRIGNWQEELVLEESKVENFKKRSQTGNLSLRKQEAKLSACNDIVPYSYSDDGVVRFGDSIILQHDSSGSILMCDPFECVVLGQEKYLVSTMKQPTITPRARNVFRIMRPRKNLADFNDDLEDPILHIGQPFLLGCCETLLIDGACNMLAPTLYLSSTKKNERTCTKRTNRQMVYMSTADDAEAIWTCILPSKGRSNASERFLANGMPLDVTMGIQVTHRQTNMYLTCDEREAVGTEFGVEYECYADRSAACGKLGLLVSEFKGASTSQTLTKPDAPVFAWHVLMSNDPSSNSATKKLPPEATIDVILANLKDSVCMRGIDGFWALRELFQNLEKQLTGKGKIDREDLKAALNAWGVNVKPRYMDDVLKLIDHGQMSLIDLNDFRQLVRGPLSAARESLLLDIWSQFTAGPSGSVPLDELASKFNGHDHPIVSIGGATEADALNHFLRSFDVKGVRPKAASFEKFADYYADLSAAIDDDAYFFGIVESNWKH